MALNAQQEQLVVLQREIRRYGGEAADQLERAARSMGEVNESAVREIIEAMEMQQRRPMQLHEKLLEILVIQRPLAGELRTVYAGAVMLSLLEEILGMTVDISTHALQVMGRGGLQRFHGELQRLFHVVTSMLRGCMESYVTKNPVQWKILHAEYASAMSVHALLLQLLQESWADEMLPPVAVNAMLIAQDLKWVTERVMSLGRWVQFVLTGEWNEVETPRREELA